MNDCFDLVVLYYSIQLGITFSHFCVIEWEKWRAKRCKRAMPPQAIGEGVLEQTIWCLLPVYAILTSLVPCRTSNQETPFILIANMLPAATIFGLTTALLLQKLGGGLVRFSLGWSLLFGLGVAIFGGSWKFWQTSWLFWAIFIGIVGCYLSLCVRHNQYLRQKRSS